VLAACSTADEASAPASDASPIMAEAAAPDGCFTRLTATPAHPFLAEFARQVTVNCGAAQTTLELQLDPGRLGRVELVRTGEGLLAVTDAFQSTTVRTRDTTVLEVGLHAGKLDRYTTPCATTQVFRRAHGTFLGAFDYCDRRWQFLRPS
jgi:hypothetical protein